MKRRFPLRPKAMFPKAVSGEAMPLDTKPILGSTKNKIVLFPNLSRYRAKTSSQKSGKYVYLNLNEFLLGYSIFTVNGYDEKAVSGGRIC